MTPSDFLKALTQKLRLRGQPFYSAARAAFAADCWLVPEDDPALGQ